MPRRKTNLFDRRITIQKFISQKNELGDRVKQWEDFKTAWAMIKTIKGSEYVQASSVKAEIISRFVIRYTEGITNDMRIIFKARVYEIIEPPINDDELNETLTIIAKEVV